MGPTGPVIIPVSCSFQVPYGLQRIQVECYIFHRMDDFPDTQLQSTEGTLIIYYYVSSINVKGKRTSASRCYTENELYYVVKLLLLVFQIRSLQRSHRHRHRIETTSVLKVFVAWNLAHC